MSKTHIKQVQGTLFNIVVFALDDLSGTTAAMTIVEGNCLDETAGLAPVPGPILASLTSSPANGLVIDTVAKTVTATVNALNTASWPVGWVTYQLFITPTPETRYCLAQGLIEVTDDISTP